METSRTIHDRDVDESSGLDPTQAAARDKNDINFGWFTLPASSEASTRPRGKANTTKSDGAFPTNSNDVDQFSQGEPDIARHACETPESYRSDAQAGGDRKDGGHRPVTASGIAQETETDPDVIPTMTVKYSEDFVVDWPLSSVGVEQSRRVSDPEPHNQPRASSTRSWLQESAPQVPPTPLPPLHWHGYRGSSRPTYKTWRDEWHKRNDTNQIQTRLDGNNNANVGEDQDCCENEKDLTTTVSPGPLNGPFHNGSDISSGLFHGPDKSCVPVAFRTDGKAVYMSLPQTMKKTTLLDSARSRIQSFPFLKWSCWNKGKGSHVKLLKYKKLSDEDCGEDNNFFNNY